MSFQLQPTAAPTTLQQDFSKLSLKSLGDEQVVSVPKSIEPKVIFYADFLDGYGIRQQYEFYRQALTSMPFHFNKDGIQMIRGNGTNSFIISSQIDQRKLLHYYYDPSFSNCPGTDGYIVNPNLISFYTQIKSVAKKESFKMIQYSSHPNIIIIQFYGGVRSSGNQVAIPVDRYEHVEYSVDDGIGPEDEPNTKMPLSAFCTTFVNIARQKGVPQVELAVYPQGLVIISGDGTGNTSRCSSNGHCDESDKSKIYKVVIPIDLVKAFAKMINFNSCGVIQIYSKMNKIARLVVDNGTYGNTTCLVREKSSDI